MDEDKGLTKTERIIKDARDCLKRFREREYDNISRAEEAIRFRALEQWPQAIKEDREGKNQDGGPRPCPVIDKTNQYTRQIVNEERQNRAAIKVRPVDDDADPKVAETFTGIIRHIEDASNAIEAYTYAGEQAIDGGFGYWRILTEYEDDMSFDQAIRIVRVPNRFSVALGPHTDPDGADCKEAVIWEDMERDDFKREYPKAKEVDFDNASDWSEKDTVRVAEYMKVDEEPTTIHQMQDGAVLTDEDLKQAQALYATIPPEMAEDIPPPEPVQSRTTQVKTVKWYKLTNEEILEKADMLGTYIPVVKVVGNELFMPDGTCRLSGAIEAAMDAQRLHNYSIAGFIETVALAPKAPWLAEAQSIKGFENEYKLANRQNIGVLKYNGFDDANNPINPPIRTTPAGMSPGWHQVIQYTEHGVEGSYGMYGPSVGAKSQEKSGIALQEQKIQGMIGNYHFPDNLARSIQHTGRILIQWIPKVYDTERVARILGEDGEPDMVKLNPNQEQAITPDVDQQGKEIGSIYNLNVGKYDVTVATGPSYTAKRQEGAEMMSQVMQGSPDLTPIIGDLFFKATDWPYSEEIAKRLKAMAPPEIQALDEKGDEVDPKIQAMMKHIEEQAMMLEQRGQDLMDAEKEVETQATEVNADRITNESQLKDIEHQRQLLASDIKVANAQALLAAAKLEVQANKIKEEINALSESDDDTEEEEGEKNEQLEQINTLLEAMNANIQQLGANPIVVNVDAKQGPVKKEFAFTKPDGTQITGQSVETQSS